MFKNPILVAFLTHFAYFYGKKTNKKIKTKKSGPVTLNQIWVSNTTPKLKKTNDPISRKHHDRWQKNGWIYRWKDRWADKTVFHRTHPAITKDPIILKKYGPFSTFLKLYIASQVNGSSDIVHKGVPVTPFLRDPPLDPACPPPFKIFEHLL